VPSQKDQVQTVSCFAQPDAATVAASYDRVRDQLAVRFPKIGPFMDRPKPKFSRSPRSPGRTGPRSVLGCIAALAADATLTASERLSAVLMLVYGWA